MENDGNSVTTRDTLRVGAEFDSEQLCTAITNYQVFKLRRLIHEEFKGPGSWSSRAPKRHYSDALVYSEIDYACKQGVCEYKSRSKGIRKIQRSVVLVKSAGIMRNDESMNPWFSGLDFFIHLTM